MRGLRLKREERKLTQSQLAKRMGVTEQTIRNYERGDTLQQTVLDRLAEILNCQPGDLVNTPVPAEVADA